MQGILDSIAARHVTSFYGKLSKGQRADPNLQGFFIAIPRLSPQALEFTQDIEGDRFTVLTARQICDRLAERGKLPELVSAGRFITDRSIAITKYGLFVAGKENDPQTRTASRIIIRAADGRVPTPAIDLLAETSYAQQLPIHDDAGPAAASSVTVEEPLIATVRGSKSNFEYQLPASPRFFVGRTVAVQE